MDVLDPKEDLRLYAQIEEDIRDKEEKRKEEIHEMQGQLKGEIL